MIANFVVGVRTLLHAGGQRTDGQLHEWVRRRLEVAADVHSLQAREIPILCCGGGTPHRPPMLTPQGFVLHEGTELAKFFVREVSPNSSHRWSALLAFNTKQSG